MLGDAGLEAALMLDGQGAVRALGEDKRPDTKGVPRTFVGVSVPVIEVTELNRNVIGVNTYNGDFFGVGRPFSVLQVAIFIHIKTEALTALACEFDE